MRISDWSSDVCSSDLNAGLNVNAIYERLGYNAEDLPLREMRTPHQLQAYFWETVEAVTGDPEIGLHLCPHLPVFHGEVLKYLIFSSATLGERSEEHTYELQSLMRISYAVFCLKKKTETQNT